MFLKLPVDHILEIDCTNQCGDEYKDRGLSENKCLRAF